MCIAQGAIHLSNIHSTPLAYLKIYQLAERCILILFLCWLFMTLSRNLNLEACILNLYFFPDLLCYCRLIIYCSMLRNPFLVVMYFFNLDLFLALSRTELAFRNSSGDCCSSLFLLIWRGLRCLYCHFIVTDMSAETFSPFWYFFDRQEKILQNKSSFFSLATAKWLFL